jgi:hypothetical protein
MQDMECFVSRLMRTAGVGDLRGQRCVLWPLRAALSGLFLGAARERVSPLFDFLYLYASRAREREREER